MTDPNRTKHNYEHGTRISLVPHEITVKKKRFHTTLTERIKYKSVSAVDQNITFDLELLSLLTNHLWNIYRVSPLNNFKIGPTQLKNYATKIKQELVKESEGSSSSVKFDTKITLIPEPKNHSEEDISIKIEVFVIKGENKPVCKYRGIIISWDNEDLSKVKLMQMPLMLCTGTIQTTRIVHRVISELFDTVIHPLRISEDDLIWLTAILSDCFSRTSKSVSFFYSIHDSARKEQIIFSLPCAIISKLWSKIHVSDSDEIKFEEVDLFNKQITSQLVSLFNVKVDLLKLNRIELPDAVISCEGKIKILSDEPMFRILTFVNDIAVIIDSPIVSMSE